MRLNKLLTAAFLALSIASDKVIFAPAAAQKELLPKKMANLATLFLKRSLSLDRQV